MKTITATPKEIRRIFQDRYEIPDYQRPYSWDKEQCEKLWDDITDFYDSSESKDDKYFLGNIVLHPSGESYVVVDGQQRLTTLMILMRAFFAKAGDYEALEECLKIKDKKSSKLTNELRVKSTVLEENKKDLIDIVFNNGKNLESDNIFRKNYDYFIEQIDNWQSIKNYISEELENLITCLLDKIVILPIECSSEDDALTIFETINNRGLSLSDADIFKAKLYSSIDENDFENKKNFIEKWNSLENHDDLFRILMHIIRADNNKTDKEISLRSFFTSNKNSYLKNCDSIMQSLDMICKIYYWESNNVFDDIYWGILDTYPNYYWRYPLFVFLHKYGFLNIDDNFELSNEYAEKYSELIKETVKYFFIKGINYNSVNAVKDTIFHVCAKIISNEDYLNRYKDNLGKDDFDQFAVKLRLNNLGRYQKGLVVLSSFLNPNQNINKFNELIWSNDYQIEHILPVKWNDYYDWNERTAKELLNNLGNLIPLETKSNISVKNFFFRKKQELYKDSKIQDAIDLTVLSDWTPKNVKEKQEKKLERLLDFFEI